MTTFTLYPAGRCQHCGEPINETHMLESVARPHRPGLMGGGQGLPQQRPVVILVHTGSGHSRCEGRETLAERDAR